jgi:hypothetical protein
LAALAALIGPATAFARPARQATAATVTVTFTDATLHASPANPQAGLTTFVVVNKGKHVHALVVSGPGVRNARSTKVLPGHSADLTVTLKPGAYELSDPAGLGEYNVQYLDIIPASTLSATGSADVVTTPPPPPPMCGQYYTP